MSSFQDTLYSDLQFFLSSNTIEIDLVTTVVTQSKYASVGSGKTEKLCRVQIKLGLLFPPPPLHPPAPSPPPDQMHIFMFDPRPKEISTKAWLLSHVCYFKMEGSIDRKQRGIPKLRDLLRRQRRESEVTV